MTRPAKTRAWRILLVGAGFPALLGASASAAPATATMATAAAASHMASRTTSHAALHATGDTMLVAARELPRGTVLRAGDVDTLVTDDGATAGSATGPATTPATSRADAPGAGWVVRRLVRKGEPLREPAVAPRRSSSPARR